MNKITVITVTYNAAATLEKSILSVINQSYPNIEYIIIDGKSTDGTLEVLHAYKNKLAYCISEQDNGIYDAMNKGIRVSTGEWIIFLGADDVLYNTNVLDKIFKNRNVDDVDLIYGNVVLKSKRKISGGPRTYQLLIEQNIYHQAIFYKRSLFDKTCFYSLRYKILADYDLNLRIFRNASLIKQYIPEIITLYNDRGISTTVIDARFFNDQLNHFIYNEKIPPKSPQLQHYYFYDGFAKILQKQPVAGLKNILHSIFFNRRKLYYFLLSIKLFLSLAGFGKKVKVAANDAATPAYN